MILRQSAITLGALFVTLSLYVIMDRMVGRDRTRLLNAIDAQPIEFVRTPLEDRSRTKDRRRKPPPKPKQIKPVRADLQTNLSRAASLPADTLAFNVKSLLGEGGGVALGQRLVEGNEESLELVMASDLTPLTMLPPQYPPTALMRGLEGWVDLVFLVTAEGTVEEPTVVAAKPTRTFDAAARAAALHWRFRPVVRDGQPVPVRARMRIDFELP